MQGHAATLADAGLGLVEEAIYCHQAPLVAYESPSNAVQCSLRIICCLLLPKFAEILTGPPAAHGLSPGLGKLLQTDHFTLKSAAY